MKLRPSASRSLRWELHAPYNDAAARLLPPAAVRLFDVAELSSRRPDASGAHARAASRHHRAGGGAAVKEGDCLHYSFAEVPRLVGAERRSQQFGGLPSYWVVLFFNHLDAVLSESSECAGDACDRTPLVIAAEAAAARDAGA